MGPGKSRKGGNSHGASRSHGRCSCDGCGQLSWRIVDVNRYTTVDVDDSIVRDIRVDENRVCDDVSLDIHLDDRAARWADILSFEQRNDGASERPANEACSDHRGFGEEHNGAEPGSDDKDGLTRDRRM